MNELTEREIEVAKLAHKSNAQIGKLLDISPNTVKIHLNHIYEKLKLSTAAKKAKSSCRAALILMVERGKI